MVDRLRRVDDLADADVDAILARAVAHASERVPPTATGAIVSLAFFEPSLRTRAGFAVAAHRIGAHPVETVERRAPESSLPESIEDTVRVLSGYADALVVRSSRPAARIDDAIRSDLPWVSGGDDAEHPSQALIDLFAIERMVAPVGDVHVVIAGDLRMRSARSLLRLLARRPPARLTVLSDAALGASELPAGAVVAGSAAELADVDVLYAVGIPKGAADETVRARLRVDGTALATLSPRGAVLSPMPVIDEVALSVRDDPRVRYLEQSDLALYVRMALLEHLLGVG